VTRVDVGATRCAMLRVVSLSIVALFSMALAACGGGSIFGGTTQSVASSPPPTASVSFVQIIGAPSDVTSKLQEAVSSAARAREITLASAREADYNVRGYLVAENVRKGIKVSYIWDISDRKGKRVRRIQNEEIVEGRKTGDPWVAVNDAALKKVAVKTTTELSEWLTKQATSRRVSGSGRVASASAPPESMSGSIRPASAIHPVRATSSRTVPVNAAMTRTSSQGGTGAFVTFVTPVSGAPGDGRRSLTSAMKRHLSQQGFKLAEGHLAGAYTVNGSVQMGPAQDGQQPITIRWLVKDPSGAPLANAVVQRNKVPAGSLDRTWGQIADLAAGEAAKKVAELLPRPSS
jgi:hypothetical protein